MPPYCLDVYAKELLLQVKIALVGKYVGLTDSYLSVVKVGFGFECILTR